MSKRCAERLLSICISTQIKRREHGDLHSTSYREQDMDMTQLLIEDQITKDKSNGNLKPKIL